MTRIKHLLAVGALALTAGTIGCSSSDDDCADGGDGGTCSQNDASTDAASGDSVTLFRLTAGDSCFKVTAIAAGSSDGCDIGVAGVATAMASLPVNYDATTGTVSVGTMGALGAGLVRNNMGTLTRENDPTDSEMPTCNWHQRDDTALVMLADDKFTASVTEVRSSFAAACTAPPAGGTCTGTWTWTMERNPTPATPFPACGRPQ